MSSLQYSIRCTLSFFDIFCQPLTVPEVYRFLYQPSLDVTIGDVEREIAGMPGVQSVGGLFFLTGGHASVHTRDEHTRVQIQKMKRAKRAIRLIRLVPFVRAVFVCNTVAFGVPTDQSDIDVLVITEDQRVFVTRFLVTLMLSLCGLRRHGVDIRNQICLSFYLSESALSLQSIAIERDVYLAHWIALLIPVYDPYAIYARLLEQNSWVSEMLPHALRPYIPAAHIRVRDSYLSRALRVVVHIVLFSWLLLIAERVTKWLQLRWMRDKLNRPRDITTAVIVSDSMLKFHEEDRRVFYREEWSRNLELGMKNNIDWD